MPPDAQAVYNEGVVLIQQICKLTERCMAWLILAVAVLTFLYPPAGLWLETGWINGLLMAVMFGMGLTLKAGDFRLILLRPRDMLIGCAAQFTLMPLLAWLLCCLFAPEPALATGIILVGTCPGGTASNVVTYLAKGDVCLSVGMTTLNTLLAPLLTPLITWLILRTTVEVDALAMLLSILQVVILPIAAGLLLRHFCGRTVQRILPGMPALSILAICAIVACVVSHHAERIATCGLLLLALVICHNLAGYVCGYGLGRLLRLSPAKCRALSIEIGMQNSGLAVALAHSAFPALPAAAVPGALFSVWHNFFGSLLASLFRRRMRAAKED